MKLSDPIKVNNTDWQRMQKYHADMLKDVFSFSDEQAELTASEIDQELKWRHEYAQRLKTCKDDENWAQQAHENWLIQEEDKTENDYSRA